MTLPDLVKHVQDTDGCNVEQARRQIRDALADGTL